MTQETLKKLAQLLEQDQFELILPENVQPDETKIEGEGTRGRDIRLVYLMNDAAESFLVFRNARMTGEYHSEYQGQLQATMNRQADGYVMVVRQGATVLTLFFEDIDLEVHLYETLVFQELNFGKALILQLVLVLLLARIFLLFCFLQKGRKL